MGRVSLKRVTLFNFRSFEGKHVLDLDDKGLVLLLGRSGAGKSSIFLSIAYALDFLPYSGKEQKCWHSEEPMWVELELSTPDGDVVIHRGDKTWVKVGSKPKVTSAKAVAEAIDKAIGLSKTLREALTFRRQRQPGMFLAKTDREKKEFLVELLGLQWLEREIEASVKRVSAASKLVDQYEPLLKKADEDLKFSESNVTGLVPEDVTALAAAVVEAQDAHDGVEAQRDYMLGRFKMAVDREQSIAQRIRDNWDQQPTNEMVRLRGLIGECIHRENRAKFIEEQRLQKFENEQKAFRDSLRILTNEIATLPGLRRQVTALCEEREALQQQKCGTCSRPWDQAEARLCEVRDQLLSVQNRMEAIEANSETATKLEEALMERFVSSGKVEKLREMRALAEQQFAAEEAKQPNVEDTVRAVLEDPRRPSAKYQKQVDAFRADLIERTCDLIAAKQALADARARNRERLAKSDTEQKFVARARAARNAALTDIHNARGTFNQERDYLDMLRGFLGQIFEEILREIADEANSVIGAIPNTASVTLRFAVERETQDGKLRNEITPIVSFAGREAPMESGASGGMYTSIEVAVDLAVSRVITRRTGCDLAWIIMDESFNGHTTHEKESCLEILKGYSADKLILIVDHASEFKELFTRVVEIKNDNGRSSFTEAT